MGRWYLQSLMTAYTNEWILIIARPTYFNFGIHHSRVIFLLQNFLWSITLLFEHILLYMYYKMCSKSGVMEQWKFDGKKFLNCKVQIFPRKYISLKWIIVPQIMLIWSKIYISKSVLTKMHQKWIISCCVLAGKRGL